MARESLTLMPHFQITLFPPKTRCWRPRNDGCGATRSPGEMGLKSGWKSQQSMCQIISCCGLRPRRHPQSGATTGRRGPQFSSDRRISVFCEGQQLRQGSLLGRRVHCAKTDGSGGLRDLSRRPRDQEKNGTQNSETTSAPRWRRTRRRVTANAAWSNPKPRVSSAEKPSRFRDHRSLEGISTRSVPFIFARNIGAPLIFINRKLPLRQRRNTEFFRLTFGEIPTIQTSRLTH